jgi:hypothetical protein
MALRSAHGNGEGALVRIETLPVDELPSLNADDTRVGLASVARRGTPFQRGNRAAAGRPPALATSAGIPATATDPRYKKALGWAKRYRAQRIKELTIQSGGELSAGVCALITSSALDMASSRYLSVLAAETGDPALMKQASALGMSSRQMELTALEIASREAAARPRKPVDYLADV